MGAPRQPKSCRSSRAVPMKIIVVTHNGEEKSASMYGDDTIGELKRKTGTIGDLEDESGTVFADDAATLGSCKVRHNARLVSKAAAANGSTEVKQAGGRPRTLRDLEKVDAKLSEGANPTAKEQKAERLRQMRQKPAWLKAEGDNESTTSTAAAGEGGGAIAQMKAERAAKKALEQAAEQAELDRATSLGIQLKGRNTCMCGTMFIGWEKMLQHFDRSAGPHRTRADGDDTPWDGPVDVTFMARGGVNPGCSMAQQALAAQHKGKRLDLIFSGMIPDNVVDESPASTPSGSLATVDLTEVNAETGSSRDMTSKSAKPPSEVIPGLMWQAGRKDCAEMGAVPHGCFTHSVYALNHSPCATPYACEESFFVDLADQLGAFIQPYFRPVCEWIDKARESTPDCRVVVHCQHGQSRSGALVVAYVMWHLKLSLKDAVEMTQKSRPALRMNVAFLSQLQSFEMELFGTNENSISLEKLDKMDVCKCYYAINEVPCEVARGQKEYEVWKPAPTPQAE